MAIASIKDVPEKSIITFRSKNPNDTVLWLGTLESKGTYRSIRSILNNPASYNEAVRQTDPTVSSDINDLLYFMITVENKATPETIAVFADEWIQPGSLAIMNLSNQVKIQVEDPNNNTQAILSLLASAGYVAKQIS